MDWQDYPAEKRKLLDSILSGGGLPVVQAVNYALAVAVFGAAFGVRLALFSSQSGLPFLTFYPAVAISALVLGSGPGLLTVVLSSIGGLYFFMPAYSSFMMDYSQGLAVATFVLSGILVCFLAQQMRSQANALGKALKESDDLYNNAPVGYHSLGQDGSFKRINEIELKWLGYQREEIVGRMKLPDVLTAASQKVFEQNFPIFLERGWLSGLELEMVRKDGSIIPVLIQATAIRDEQGRIQSSRTTVFDLTERKRTEEKLIKLSLALEQSTESIVITDAEVNIEFVNDAFTRISGYGREEAIGQKPSFLKSGLTSQDTYGKIWAALKAGQSWQGDLINRRKNGEIYPEHTILSPILQADGSVTGYLGVKADITEKRRTEEELVRYREHLEELVKQRTADLLIAKEVAEEATRAKSVFLANMSHEIRTPLNVIIAIGYLLRRDIGDTFHQNRLEQLCASSEHLLALIDDILDLSKIEAQRIELASADFSLAAVVDRVVRMVASRAQEKSLPLSVAVAPRLQGLFLKGDELRLSQVLINLCVNAVKFSERGAVSLAIDAMAEEVAQVELRFTVKDAGIGIAPADQARLFQAFEQVDSSTTRSHGGTGLGLSISQRLVEMMGGTIEVDSQLGAGSTFSFALLLQRGVASGLVPAATSAGLVEANFQGRRVLFAEDHPQSQEILLDMLEGIGCAADVAADGVEAVDCAQERNYDLILMDMQMPRLDGLEATRAIRRLPGYRDIPIIALTANAFAEDRQSCLDAGMSDYLAKPVTPAKLSAALGRWLVDLVVPVAAMCDSETGNSLARIPGLAPPGEWLNSPARINSYCAQLRTFVDTQGEALELLREKLANDDIDGARTVAHNLDGIAGLLGATRLAALAKDISAALRSAAAGPGVAALLGSCRAELSQLQLAVSALPAGDNASSGAPS